MRRLPRSFFERPTLHVARDLIGKALVFGDRAGIVVETEAYCGRHDPAAHTYRRRIDVFEGPKGFAYVYLVYGMYHCLNVTSGPPGEPECVLIRALEPLRGLHRPANGPGRLCLAMGITRRHLGEDMVRGPLHFEEVDRPRAPIRRAPRVGIGYAGRAARWLWRFFEEGNPHVSV